MIELKTKKCKGTGLAKGYGCGKLTKYRKFGLGKMCCLADWYLNSENGKVKLQKETLKVVKPRKEFEKFKKQNQEEKSLPKALKQTQDVFNRYIRLRDEYKPCISSDVSWRSDFDAGHLFSVKQFNELRFEEDNVHAQSIGENRFNEGNFEDYIIKVEKRIGKERLNILIKKADLSKQRTKKWSLHELKEIRNKYNQKIKEL